MLFILLSRNGSHILNRLNILAEVGDVVLHSGGKMAIGRASRFKLQDPCCLPEIVDLSVWFSFLNIQDAVDIAILIRILYLSILSASKSLCRSWPEFCFRSNSMFAT